MPEQVEFDVRDYRPEELSIKTEGDVLIVLAKHETKTEDGGSFVSKQFEQRFTLPSGVKPESITSSLARDGTLTVSAPRETPAIAHHSPVGKKNSNNELTNVYGHEERNEGLPHPRVKYDDDKFQISLDCHRYRPEELDVKVEGSSIIITAKQVGTIENEEEEEGDENEEKEKKEKWPYSTQKTRSSLKRVFVSGRRERH
jgi:HSP20 family molecular chaperone IbpA